MYPFYYFKKWKKKWQNFSEMDKNKCPKWQNSEIKFEKAFSKSGFTRRCSKYHKNNVKSISITKMSI